MAKSRTAWPTQKITAVALGGAASTLIVWSIANFSGKAVTPEVASAITTIATFAAGYITPPKEGENIEDTSHLAKISE
ncbi:MAG TPA: hypothetical protein DCY88_03600 [Cyanobacteria bacterium UBA11372]|nr:hypothetical protein [Cyanobacteria bacterium UBA11372]